MSIPTAFVLFGLLSLLLVGFEIMFTYATRGFGYGFSANREPLDMSAFATRLKRTWQNHVESAAYVLPALLGVHLTGLTSPNVMLATLILLLGRALFIPLYLSGITFIRVPAFVMGTFSSAYLLIMALIS